MDKVRILITDGMAENGSTVLKSNSRFDVDLRDKVSEEELEKIVGNYECIVIRSATTLTHPIIQKATQMKLIVRAGAGVDNIDVKAATEKNIPVMNTASANSLAAAEQTIALMFSMLRQLPLAAQSLKEGRWDRKKFKGFEATGKTLGVVGLGNIGRLVAEKAVGIGMKVAIFDPIVKNQSQLSGPLSRMDESIRIVNTVDELLPLTDILTVHVPKTEETHKLINSSRISKLKDGAFILNCARGGIVDEEAVMEAVDTGKLRGAAFDVYENEPPKFPNRLFEHEKIVCAPHLGASTVEAQSRVALTAATQIVNFFESEDKTGVINSI